MGLVFISGDIIAPIKGENYDPKYLYELFAA